MIVCTKRGSCIKRGFFLFIGVCFIRRNNEALKNANALMHGTVQQNVDWIVDMGEKQHKGLKQKKKKQNSNKMKMEKMESKQNTENSRLHRALR